MKNLHTFTLCLLQGGLTDLWLDDPYVLAAKKLIKWATEENEAGNVFPVSRPLETLQHYQINRTQSLIQLHALCSLSCNCACETLTAHRRSTNNPLQEVSRFVFDLHGMALLASFAWCNAWTAAQV